MDKYYVLVTGNGITSRANLEALMEDYFYSKGKNGVLAVAYKDKPSQGQVFATQYAKDKDKDIVVFCKDESSFQGMPSSTLITDADPHTKAVEFLSKENSAVFILWSDEDPDSAAVLALCQEAGITAFDLTNGLLAITPSATLEVIDEPAIPVQENLPQDEPDDEDDEYEDDEDEYEELLEDEEEDKTVIEDELMADAYMGIVALVRLLVDSAKDEIILAVKEALADTPQKPLKGPKA